MIPQAREVDANLTLAGRAIPASRVMPLRRDLQLIVGPYRPHTLLVGSADRTASVIDELHADLVPPISVHDCATAMELPPDGGTIIMRNLEALDAHGQHALMAHLDAAHKGLQIISVAERSPFTLVQRGRFLEALYRRLSLIYLWLEAPIPD
jgi:hypothetical protein